MSLEPKSETQELRALLQGAMADKLVLEARLETAHRELVALQNVNAAQRTELVKLRAMRDQIWQGGPTLEELRDRVAALEEYRGGYISRAEVEAILADEGGQ